MSKKHHAQHCSHSPKIDYKHYYICREQIHSVNASPSIYQMEKQPNMKLISSYTWMHYSINMSWIQTISSWLLSYLKHVNTQCLRKHMTNLVTRELLTHTALSHTNIIRKAWIRTLGNTYLTVHFATGKSKGSILPSANDRDTRMTIWQNSHWLGHRMWNFQFGWQSYLHNHWSPHTMAGSFPNTRQISRYHNIHIYKSLPSIFTCALDTYYQTMALDSRIT